ncbi:transcriptional regulator [Betalipothrixvirus uzonense]|uniref:Putative RHH transcriptional regulator n=1 Tax=Betalipothrixvirus uzonense TaxID=512792 RepID=B2CRK3_9VIRU|nr:transcriptional regulator [Acidianus filamentous virus 9]ACB37260.1 putative RHH transcriptional regulator [Acidianus filamentous virus 9]
MNVLVEKSVYDKLKEEAEKRGISIPGIIRELLVEYFGLEDNTRSYKRKEIENEVIKVGEKEYVRLQVKLRKENEILIKNELRKRGISINQLIKNEILLLA